jgi:hypothetical protein
MVTSNNNQKYNHLELRNRIQNKSDALHLTSNTVPLPSMVTSNNDQKFNHQELRNRIQNKSDALREWGSPHLTDTMNGNEIWYYNIISTDSPAEIIVEQHNDMPNSENLKLSDKYIELHFVGDEVVNCQTKGVDNYPRGNKLLRKVLIGAGLMVGGAMVFIIIVSIQFKRAGGFN